MRGCVCCVCAPPPVCVLQEPLEVVRAIKLAWSDFAPMFERMATNGTTAAEEARAAPARVVVSFLHDSYDPHCCDGLRPRSPGATTRRFDAGVFRLP